IINSPEALWVRLISFFPPFTPTMMLIRSAFGEVPVWEILLSIFVLAGFSIIAENAPGQALGLPRLILAN
ncbi:hypothetical protein KGY72_09235, partial [Candidatus Bipolaricaulota bacterium]|nr:hypothetical protein [Candidatus Bipolaricaulota bacterium]